MASLLAQQGRGAAVDVDRFVAELIQAQHRIRVLENLIIRQHKALMKTEHTVDQNQAVETDLRDAQDQCQAALISVLAGERRVDPGDL